MPPSLQPPAPAADASPVSWHFRRTLALALPIIVSRTGLVLLFTVDSVVTGQSGALELAAFGLGAAPLMTLMLVCLGAMQATVVLTAQATGRGEAKAVGAVLQAALVNALLLGLSVTVMSVFAEPFFLAIGQDPAVSGIAADVAFAFGWGMPGLLLFMTSSLVLEATDRARVGMLIMIGANVVNIALDGILVLGWGGWVEPGGAETAMVTSSIVRWGAFLAAIAVLLLSAARDGDRLGILGRRADWILALTTIGGETGRRIRRLGLPMGLGQGVESAAFATIVFFAGLLGTTVLAVHQTTMTVLALVYMNAVGLGGAATIRVGNALGRRFAVDLRRAGWTAIGLGGLFSGLLGLVMIAIPETIARAIVDDPEVAALAAKTIRFCGFITAFDSMMGVSMGALRGMGDVWMPLWMQSAAFWFVGVPVSWFAATVWGFGAIGLFMGIAAGIAASLLLLMPRFARESRALVRRLAAETAAPLTALP